MNEDLRSIFDEDTRTDEEKAYFDLIDRAAVDKTDLLITNGKPSHAVYLMFKFLETATERVLILTPNLKRALDGVYAYEDPKLANAAVDFLRKPNARLSILVGSDPDLDEGESINQHPFIARILEMSNTPRLDVYMNTEGRMPRRDFHFMVMDQQAYRIETDTERVKALANFGDPKPIGTLSQFFGACAEVCERSSFEEKK